MSDESGFIPPNAAQIEAGKKFVGRKRKSPARYDERMKQEFVKNTVESGGNTKLAYAKTFPGVTEASAQTLGNQLFKDPYVQRIYTQAGVDVPYLAARSRELMDSENETVASNMVRTFVKPLLNDQTVQRVEKLNVNLFGDLSDEQLDKVKRGRLIRARRTGG